MQYVELALPLVARDLLYLIIPAVNFLINVVRHI